MYALFKKAIIFCFGLCKTTFVYRIVKMEKVDYQEL